MREGGYSSDVFSSSLDHLLRLVALEIVDYGAACDAALLVGKMLVETTAPNSYRGARGATVPEKLLHAVPPLLQFLIRCHNTVDSKARESENVVLNILFRAVVCSNAQQEELRAGLVGQLTFLLGAAGVQLAAVQSGTMRITSPPSVSFVPRDLMYLPLADDYLWLSIFSLLFIGADPIHAHFASLLSNGREDVPFVHAQLDVLVGLCELYSTLHVANFVVPRDSRDAGSPFSASSPSALWAPLHTTYFPLPVVGSRVESRPAKQTMSIAAEAPAVLDRVTLVLSAAMKGVLVKEKATMTEINDSDDEDESRMVPPLIVVRVLRVWGSVAWCLYTAAIAGLTGQSSVLHSASSRLMRLFGDHIVASLPLPSAGQQLCTTLFFAVAGWTAATEAHAAQQKSNQHLKHRPHGVCARLLATALCSSPSGERHVALWTAESVDTLCRLHEAVDDAFTGTARLSGHVLAATDLISLTCELVAEGTNAVPADRRDWEEAVRLLALAREMSSDDKEMALEASWSAAVAFLNTIQVAAAPSASSGSIGSVDLLMDDWDDYSSWGTAKAQQVFSPGALPRQLSASLRALNETVRQCLEARQPSAAASYIEAYCQLLVIAPVSPLVTCRLLESAATLVERGVRKRPQFEDDQHAAAATDACMDRSAAFELLFVGMSSVALSSRVCAEA